MPISSSFRFSPSSSVARSFPAAAVPLPSRCCRAFLPKRSVKFDVKCTYQSDPSLTTQYAAPTPPIDVVADAKSQQIVVLGGSGFVGSAVCKVAVSKGIKVTSLSRSGRPTLSDPWVDQVSWVSGDVFHANWEEILVGATAVVSTVGGYGSEEEMQRINGEANIAAVNAAKNFGIPKFILISIHDYNLPPFLMQSAFFTAKKKAESEVLSKYPRSGIVLKPALTYGKRTVNGVEFHWDHIGEPVQKFLNDIENFTRPLSSIPGSDLILAPPVHVDDVAHAVVHALTEDDVFGVLTIQQIKEAAAKAKV